MKRLLLINDTQDQQNWGAQVGAYALKKIFANNPTQEIEIRTLSYGWMEERYVITPKWLGGKTLSDIKLNRLGMLLSQPLANLPLIADEYEYVADMWLKNKSDPIANIFTEMCKDTDIVVFNGEGSVYRNNYTAIKGLFLLWFAHNKLNKPSFFLNGSVHLTHVDPVLPAMVRKTFNQTGQVAVREPWSKKNLKEFYPEISAEIIPDSVFYLFDEINTLPKPSSIEQGFCAFSPPMLLTAIKDVYRSPKEYSWLYKIVVEIKKIVPQVVLLAKEPRDTVLQKLAEDTNSIYFGPNNSVDDFITILRQAKLLISGRYHHLILASILGIPCIPMATTSHKIHGLCELFEGSIGFPYDCTDLGNEFENIINETSLLIRDGKDKGSRLQMYARKFSKDSLLLNKLVDLS